MDLDNPVIAKLVDRAYAEKLATETQKLAAEAQKLRQKLQEELALAVQRAAKAEAALHEMVMAQQWQEVIFKILKYRFPTVPMALILLLQAVKPAQRSRVSDISLDSPDVDSCLQALRQLQAEA